MNWGPRLETISSGRPKFLKTWLNIHSAVSKALGSPLRGINLHAFEKQSTVTRTQVLPSELGWSTTKSIPYLGPGSSWDWQWHEFAYWEVSGHLRHGTDWAAADVPDDIPGHTGPPEPNLKEREGLCAACVSRAQNIVQWAPEGVDVVM